MTLHYDWVYFSFNIAKPCVIIEIIHGSHDILASLRIKNLLTKIMLHMLKFQASYGFRGLFLRLKHIKNKKKITSTTSNSTSHNRLQRAYSTYTKMVTYCIIDIVTIYTFESWPEEDSSKIYNFQSIRIICDHHDWRARSSDIIFKEDHHRSITTHDRGEGILKANLSFSFI
jgi:hypothetical protein